MREVVVEVPAKATLFGEHAVVYGQPAIAAALPALLRLRARAVAERVFILESDNVSIRVEKVVLDESLNVVESAVNKDQALRLAKYLTTAFTVCEERLGLRAKQGVHVKVESPLPIGAGLGTSAAVTVGSVTSCLALYGFGPEIDQKEVALLAWRAEQLAQGKASPMDTFTVTYGGLRYIMPWEPEAELLKPAKELHVVVGYTEKRSNTASMVAAVAERKKLLGEVGDELVRLIGRVSERARRAILEGDLELVGLLMDVNQGLLEALGVVSADHKVLIEALRRAGALGAKTSGAGGGGAFVALARDREHAKQLSRIVEALGGSVVATSIYEGGVAVRRVDQHP